MLNFNQVGSRNLDKLTTNSVNWVQAILHNLINSGSFCWIYINWVLANLDNFGSIWVILGHFSWIRIILLNFDQLGSHNFNKLCYILVTGFSLFCWTWSILPILNHFPQYWGILLYIHQLGSRYFWLTASIWYILADWVLDNLDNFGQLRRFWCTLTNSVPGTSFNSVHLGPFWQTVFSLLWSILVNCVHFDLFWLTRFWQFLVKCSHLVQFSWLSFR